MSLVVVADLETPHEALLVRGMLRAHGIPAETTADSHPLPGTITGRLGDRASSSTPTTPRMPARCSPRRARCPAVRPEADEAADPAGPPAVRPVRTDDPGAALPGGSRAQPPVVPVAASRARRPPWVVAAMVVLVGVIMWLLLQATALVASGIT
jgi:hypothetical protein